VFYEMLTGELPLGRFAAPSQKVQVDVRLDEVVLRALEKEPERRYQQASQVKTAVETIASTTKPPSGEASETSGKILAQDYALDIRSCLRRGWGLVRSDFWPIVGISALMLLLVQAASSTAIGVVAGGPLMGGLWLYLLKRARGEPAGVETAFSGFRIAFVDLFLAGFVTFLLTLLGFFCLILPGLYLAVAWMFTSILVIDKRLDFWSAMELSRRMVAKHWFKVFGFFLVLMLMNLAGLLVCGIGVFFTAPIALAATVFAYEDIFGLARRNANEPSARVGPFGTAVLPGAPVKPASIQSGVFKPVAVGLAVAVFFLGLVAMASAIKARKAHAARAYAYQAKRQVEENLALGFGPVVERVIEFTNGNHRALNLATGKYVTSATDRPFDFSAGGIDGLRAAGIDLFFSDAALSSIEGAGGVDNNVIPQIDALDWRALNALSFIDRDEPFEGDITMVDYRFFADRLKANETAEPLKSDESIRSTNLLRFVTRDGTEGILQIDGLTDGSRSVKVR